MILLNFGFTGIEKRKGFLFGEYEKHPLTTVKFLFFSAVLFQSRQSTTLFMNALKGLLMNEEWLIENSKAARLHKKRVTARERAKVADKIREYEELAARREDKIHELTDELCSCRKVIRGLQLDLERAHSQVGSGSHEQ